MSDGHLKKKNWVLFLYVYIKLGSHSRGISPVPSEGLRYTAGEVLISGAKRLGYTASLGHGTGRRVSRANSERQHVVVLAAGKL